MSNILIANFAEGSDSAVASPVAWQYDYGQILKITGVELPFAYEVHFTNHLGDGTTKTAIGNADGVLIPDEYFQTGCDVYAYFYLHTGEDDGETEYSVRIYVKRRAQPSDAAPTPVQQSVIDQTIAALDAGVAAAEEAQRKAEEAQQGTEQYELNAEAWAVGERGGEPVQPGDETYNNNSKHYAEVAQQGAEMSGYVFFDVDDEDGCMYVTTAGHIGEDVTFEVNEQEGILEVIYS